MTIKIWLIVSGIVSALVLMMPSLVFIGMYMLVVPGLILLAAPTVFMYLATFSVLRMVLPMPPGLMLNAVAAGLTLFLGWAVVQPSVWTAKRAFDRANLPEIIPATPVALKGHIRLVMRDVSLSRGKSRTMTCNALCAAVLATPGVTAVTLVSARADKPADPVTFRLIPKSAAREQGLAPEKPESILDYLPQTPKPAGSRDFDGEIAERTRVREAAAAAWAVRLATRETLIAESADARPDMSILIDAETFTAAKGRLSRLEIRDAGDRVVLRRSILSVSTLAAPLHVGTQGNLSNFKLIWARRVFKTAPAYSELKHITELFAHSTLARPSDSSQTAAELRERLDAALADPARPATDADFSLAQVWFSTTDWSKPLSQSDISLLTRAIADPRIPIPKQLYDGYQRQVDVSLRAAIGSRIVNPSTLAEERQRLAYLLSKMPKGTFKSLSADERHFIGNGDLRKQTAQMIARLADRGAAAVPDLLAIAETESRIKLGHLRWQIHKALCLAFARLGPQANAALPALEEILNRDRSPLITQSSSRDDWNLALVRMGRSPDNINFPNSTPENTIRDRQRLRDRAARFDKSADSD